MSPVNEAFFYCYLAVKSLLINLSGISENHIFAKLYGFYYSNYNLSFAFLVLLITDKAIFNLFEKSIIDKNITYYELVVGMIAVINVVGVFICFWDIFVYFIFVSCLRFLFVNGPQFFVTIFSRVCTSNF